MARFTLLELHLDGAQFTANAPFSGEEADEGVGETIEKRFGSEPEADERDSGSSPMGKLLGIAAIVGVLAVVQRLLSGSDAASDEAEIEETIVA